MKPGQRILFVALIAPVLGCDPYTCSTDVLFGITLYVRDSVTNAMVGRESLVILQSGTVADSVRETSFNDGPYGLAPEQAGTFTVTVEKAGYQRWSKSGVQVTKQDCHVVGVSVPALLQR